MWLQNAGYNFYFYGLIKFMKKPGLICPLIILCISVSAQPGKTRKTTTKKPAPNQPSPLRTLNDSANYAIGLTVAGFCKQHGVTRPNKELITQSFTDVAHENPFFLSEATANEIVNQLSIHGRPKSKLVNQHTSSSQLKWSSNDSLSYAIGLYYASFFKQQEIATDTAFMMHAVNDVLANRSPRFDAKAANDVMNKLIIRLQEERIKPTVDSGRVFLANNRQRPQVKVTASGLQYEVVKLGDGIRPQKTDTFICHYRGTFMNGTEFDASYNRGEPLHMGVNQVISGWTEGLQLMPVGSIYKFYVPYELGYGPFGTPDGAIAGGSVLVFEIELLDVKKAKLPKKPVRPAR